MSLSTLIQNFVSSTSAEQKENKKSQTVTAIKNDHNLKQLSKYVRGGVSKMAKTELQELTDSFNTYKKNKYFVGGREIKPDPEQIKIIKAPLTHNIRVIAGAGTGKTTTIGCRIKHLLDSHVTPDKILVLTFNVEARKNLEKMIDKLMGFEIKMEIRTIDSFCFKIKNDFYGGFSYDSNNNDSESTISYSLSELGICGRKIMEKYGAEICSQYKYVFFDEFQDVNEDQFQILKCFVKNGCKLTVIGDDSQNIYQFRGSDNYYIINFDKIFPQTLTYKITTNYRSTKQIIDLANDSILNNKEKIFKMMKPNTIEGGEINLTINETEEDSIKLLIEQIEHYTTVMNIPYDEIAILSRNTHPLKTIETEFEKHSIPYVALISDQYSNDYKQIIQQNKIVLSTIHKAKGLEWKVVFIVGLSDAYFPNHLNNGLKNIEEERRLFYVGVTRAKRYLHFIGDAHEVPMSRFIGEIEEHVEIIKHTDKIPVKGLFDGSDDDRKKDSYPVTKIIEMMSGRRIESLREMKLIPNVKLNTKQLFVDPLYFTDELKKNVFESDYGIYCDYYLTRQLMVMNQQPIKDVHVESILLDLHLTDEERRIYDRYDLKNCLIKKQVPNIPDKKESEKLRRLIEKLRDCMKLTGLNAQGIEHLLSMGVQSYHYPQEFMKKLRESYEMYKNKNVGKDVVRESVYYVSLCPKFNNDRRRLVYRDIHNLYEENSATVFPRVDEYVKLLKDDDILCKLHMNKLYKIDKDTVSLVGELDYLNITKDTIVDIKCSEGEFKIEWLIQLLIYYALFMCNPTCCTNYYDIEIKKIAVFNVFTGKYYEAPIPENYDWKALLEYVRQMIADDLKGIREKHAFHTFHDENELENQNLEPENNHLEDAPNHEDDDEVWDLSAPVKSTKPKIFNKLKREKKPDDSIDVESMTTNNKTLDELVSSDEDLKIETDDIKYQTIQIPCVDSDTKTGYIVFDVENNCVNQDIIQLAYIVYSDDHKVVKRTSRYIKDRFVDNRAGQITKITTDNLRRFGTSFDAVIEEFLTDLANVLFVCGHHVHTDISKVRSNMDKYKLKPSIDLLSQIVVKDTSNLYKLVKGKGKSINLADMYKELFGKLMIKAHDALSDVEHTGRCYVMLQKMINEKNLAEAKPKKKMNSSLFKNDNEGTDPDKDQNTDENETQIVGHSKKTVKKTRVIRTLDLDDDLPIKEKTTKKIKKTISKEKKQKPSISDDSDLSSNELTVSKIATSILKKKQKKVDDMLDHGLTGIMNNNFF